MHQFHTATVQPRATSDYLYSECTRTTSISNCANSASLGRRCNNRNFSSRIDPSRRQHTSRPCDIDLWFLGPFHGAIAVPSVTRCRCRRRRRRHRCAGGVRQWRQERHLVNDNVKRLAVANGPNIFQMLLVCFSDMKGIWFVIILLSAIQKLKNKKPALCDISIMEGQLNKFLPSVKLKVYIYLYKVINFLWMTLVFNNFVWFFQCCSLVYFWCLIYASIIILSVYLLHWY